MSDHERAFQSHEQSLTTLLEAKLVDFMPALGQAGFFESDPSLRAKLLREDLPRSERVQHLFLKMQRTGEAGYDIMLRALEQIENDRLIEMAHKIRISLANNRQTMTREFYCPKEESGDSSITTSQPVFPALDVACCQEVSVPKSTMAGLDQSKVSSRQCCALKWPSVPKGYHSTSRDHDYNYKEAFGCFIEFLRYHCADYRPIREETTSNRQRAKLCYFWKVCSRGVSPLITHPDPICAQGILSSKVCGEVYTVLYRLRRTDSKAAEELVERCLQFNIPTDLKVVVATAGLSWRCESENIPPVLFQLLELAEKGEGDNCDIAVCILRAHIACIYCHKGDLKMAREVITPGLQCTLRISDPAVIEAVWVHGWLLLLEGQQGDEAFPTDHEKAIDDAYSQALARLQNEQRWYRDLSEDFKLGKADIHLRIAQQHIAVEGSHDSEVVYQLFQRARDSLLSIDMELLRLSHGNDPFTDAFHNHLWFMYHHLQGNDIEADTFLQPAFDNWIAGKGYKFAKEIAEMANNADLLQQLKDLGV